MRSLLLLLIVVFFGLKSMTSQSYETDKEAQANIQKLNFIIGEWKGKGWRMSPDDNKYTFDQTEIIQFKLDSTAVLIEGKGYSNGEVIHNAMAIITSDKESGNYSFQSFLQNGMKGSFKAEIQEGALYWYPIENIRYIIKIHDNGEWFETGEYNMQGKWIQFFEMKLKKV